MAEFDIDDLLNDENVANKVREMLAFVRNRIDEGTVNYRFVWQMLGQDNRMPTRDVLAVIISRAYAEHLREWNKNDMFLPMMFAELTVREVTRNDS